MSRWRLELPPENNYFDPNTLTDTVLHLNYTSREGGDMLRHAASAAAAGRLPGDGWSFFDVRHDFAGCIAGIHEVLRRQGLMRGIWCLNPRETLSPGQCEEIDRVIAAYPWMTDDDFVAEHRDAWLR